MISFELIMALLNLRSLLCYRTSFSVNCDLLGYHLQVDSDLLGQHGALALPVEAGSCPQSAVP